LQRKLNAIITADAIQEMVCLPDKSIDLILCDLPYGTTDCAWDKQLPMGELWEQYKRIIKDNGAILLFAQQPFATKLINAGERMFRYQIVWRRPRLWAFSTPGGCRLEYTSLSLSFTAACRRTTRR
jgi:site-specific DNA-methyltransferase (adenine-specific)